MANQVAHEAFNHLIGDLQATHGENLASVVLYGSAAAGDTTAQADDYNLLIALHHITPEDLRLAQAPTREWQRLGHPLPVYFTLAELHDAADVFPIEFQQMSRARVVLYGSDPFETLQLSDANLRHQAEYELRSKLIQLRRLYIPASVSIDQLCDLMSDSLTSFAKLFAAALRLSGIESPIVKHDIVRAAVRQFKLDGEPFEHIFDIRETGTRPATETEANDLFAAYLAQVERVVAAVDRMNVADRS
jgi:hypothetical protein